MCNKILAALMLSLCSLGVNAELVERDWNTEGDALITLDQTTGYKWLDLTLTANQSILDIQDELDSTYAGWRLPTQDEVGALLLNHFERSFTFKNSNPAGTGSAVAVDEWQSLFGLNADAGRSYGLFQSDDGNAVIAGVRNLNNYVYFGYQRSRDLDFSRDTDGVFLVSDGAVTLTEKQNASSVPVGSPVMATLALAFAGFCSRRNKTKRD